ncbi:MAG: tetratricopeptide repeat protein [Bacteroidales bacterium]
MKTRIILIALLICSFQSGYGTNTDTMLHQATKAYKAGDYQYAAAVYDSIIQTGQTSAELYYNLGNAHYKSDHLAAAILNYERALKIAPHNERIRYNLQFARASQKDDIAALPVMFYVRWWHGLCQLLPLKTWGILSIAMIFLSHILWVFFITSRNIDWRKRFFWMAVISSLLFLFVLFISLRNYHKVKNSKEAIVFESVITGKSSPDYDSTDLFVIHEGLKVSILNKIGNWYEVKLPDGTIGWLPANSLEII